MVALIAALACLSGGCAPAARHLAGTWTVEVEAQETCRGWMTLTAEGGEIRGTFQLCGWTGSAEGVLRSNELVLQMHGLDGDTLELTALLAGQTLGGQLAGNELTAWPSAAPRPTPDASTASALDDDEALASR